MMKQPRYVDQLRYYEDKPYRNEIEADSVNHLDNTYYRPFAKNQLTINRVVTCDLLIINYKCRRSSLCGNNNIFIVI